MPHVRDAIGYTCCAILVWMSVMSGFAAALSGPANQAPAIVHGVAAGEHDHHATHGHKPGSGPAVGRHAEEPAGGPIHRRDCLETCLDLIADKLLPKTLRADEPHPQPIAISFASGARLGSQWHRDVRHPWPTGPPGASRTSAKGALRLVSLSARLRI